MRLYSIGKTDEQAQAIVSERGGQVISYVVDGIEIIYLQRMIGMKLRGGIPPCFPFFGPAKPRFRDIRQHGWLRDEDLELVNEWHNSVTFRGVSKNRKGYPWWLEYEVSTSVMAVRTLELKLVVKRLNDGIKEDTPINPAFHDYFSARGRKAVNFAKLVKVSVGQDETVHLQGRKILTIDLGEKKVKMSLGGDFGEESCVTLWTDNEQYFCVEPSLTHPDDFDTPKGRYLKQGESLTLACRLQVLP